MQVTVLGRSNWSGVERKIFEEQLYSAHLWWMLRRRVNESYQRRCDIMLLMVNISFILQAFYNRISESDRYEGSQPLGSW
jgi:hypothetical protein